MDSKQAEIWDDIFSTYSNDQIDELLFNDRFTSVQHSPYLSYLNKYISRNNVIHESGCGIGQWLIYLNKKGFKHLYGIDFAQKTKEKDFSGFEFGLAKYLNAHLLNKTKLLQKNSQKWDGLTKSGNFIVKICKNLSPRITADELFIVAQKQV